jgi:hypothetical protein
MSGRTKVESFDFGWYGLTKLIIPPFNMSIVDKFYDWIGNKLKDCSDVDLEQYNRRPSLVAHSFGTWVAGYALLKYDDLRFDKIILTGSILPQDFDWATIFARDQVDFVRNECGKRDPWPSTARRLVRNSGSSGSEGFHWPGSSVDDVQFDYFGHSDFLARRHIETHWLPLLLRSPSGFLLSHGRNIDAVDDFVKTLNDTNVIDDEAYRQIEGYEKVEIPRGLSSKWIEINPDIYTFLFNRCDMKIAGYINAMPVKNDSYNNIRDGKISDNEIMASDIAPYIENDAVKIYIMSIATLREYRRCGQGLQQGAYFSLISGFMEKLVWYAKRHRVRVSHFLATAWTDPGRELCEFFGMSRVGTDKSGKPIYEIDLRNTGTTLPARTPAPLRRLMKTYADLGI